MASGSPGIVKGVIVPDRNPLLDALTDQALDRFGAGGRRHKNDQTPLLAPAPAPTGPPPNPTPGQGLDPGGFGLTGSGPPSPPPDFQVPDLGGGGRIESDRMGNPIVPMNPFIRTPGYNSFTRQGFNQIGYD